MKEKAFASDNIWGRNTHFTKKINKIQINECQHSSNQNPNNKVRKRSDHMTMIINGRWTKEKLETQLDLMKMMMILQLLTTFINIIFFVTLFWNN